MCGVVGYHGNSDTTGSFTRIAKTLDIMNHRGPDDRGLVCIGEGVSVTRKEDLRCGSNVELAPHKTAMAHVRFSIVDLTSGGHQPFVTEAGQVILTFNGEIYNYVELREELQGLGYRFNTRSDTEVFAKAYQCWGVDCFQRFVGFWAAALYDRKLNKLLLARDRIGKAPLYICQRGGVLHWASELKALLEYVPEERDRINHDAVAHFANWQKRDFGDTTFYQNIQTFPKASYAWIEADGSFKASKFWSLPRHRKSESELPVASAIEEFRAIMSDAVRIRHRADVRVAVQLSGGMDSSTLVANAVEMSDRVHAYTIKYGYGEQDEEPYARAVAERFAERVDYHVVRPSEDELFTDLPAFTKLMDEPYHSPNQMSSQRIWRLMADHDSRVVLYGAGGDEVFGGYGSEYYAPYLLQLLRQGHGIRFAKEFFSCSEYQAGFAPKDYAMMLAKMVPGVPRRSTHGDIRFVPKEINPLDPDLVQTTRRIPSSDLAERLINNMEDWRMNYWLRIDNQNSMGVPIELRCPFLDHRLIEFAFSLPSSYLIRNGWMKWIVRAAMESKLPKNVVWRRQKMGFPFPLQDWLLKNRESVLAAIDDSQCPLVNADKLQRHYDYLCRKHTEYAWGLISITLWWKFCIR